MSIKAVTFDLWDTVIVDDSDEPKRAAQGLPSKPEARRQLVEEALSRHTPITREAIDLAYATTDAAFRRVWYGLNFTWSVRERLGVLLTGLDRELPGAELDELIRRHEDMELEVRPDPVPGAVECIRILSERYKLGVVSDTIFSPGRALRQILESYGVLSFFDYLVFSDEVGASKPNPLLFREVAAGLGVEVHEIAHIGDRAEKDIAGPHAVGARGVLFRAAVQRDCGAITPDAVCDDYADLPQILAGLSLR